MGYEYSYQVIGLRSADFADRLSAMVKGRHASFFADHRGAAMSIEDAPNECCVVRYNLKDRVHLLIRDSIRDEPGVVRLEIEQVDGDPWVVSYPDAGKWNKYTPAPDYFKLTRKEAGFTSSSDVLGYLGKMIQVARVEYERYFVEWGTVAENGVIRYKREGLAYQDDYCRYGESGQVSDLLARLGLTEPTKQNLQVPT